MTLDLAGWLAGTGAHSQTDAASGKEDQFVVVRPLIAGVGFGSTVTPTSVYAANDVVGAWDMSGLGSNPLFMTADRVSWIDPDGILDPDQVEIWFPFSGSGAPVVPADHATAATDAGWVLPALFVVPAGGYDTTDLGAAGKLHSKAFPHVMALLPTLTAMFMVTNALTLSGFSSSTGPTLNIGGVLATSPT